MIATCGCAKAPCTCGCCDGIGIVTPVDIFNPPGLGALDYRVGTFATFYETMLARLSNLAIDVPSEKGTGTDTLYPLRGLTVRDTSDASIALLDAWAMIGDVLAFYQERIANEGYLATARERRSILELARLIGYRLRPGVAASVYLAFTAALDFEGDIPLGTRAQSVPGPGEKPQFFETSDKLNARAAWNAMKPRLTRPQLLSPVPKEQPPKLAVTDVRLIDSVYLDGIATNLKTGNGLLFIFNGDPGGQYLRLVESVTAQAADKRTEVVLSQNFRALSTTQILQLYIDKANYLFEDSALADDVAAILQALSNNFTAASQASTLVRLGVAQLQEKLSIAKHRGFSRIAAWIAHIIQILPTLGSIAKGPGGGGGGGGGGATLIYNPAFAASALAASPLGNLVAMASSLALPPSVQPANALRLNRSVEHSFVPQSDIAARLLAQFKPTAADALYPAWKSVASPYGWVEVYATRVKTGLFASRFAGKVTVPGVGGAATYEAPTIFIAWKGLVVKDHNEQVPTGVALDGVYDEIKPGSWVAIDRPTIDGSGNPLTDRVTTFHLVQAVRASDLDTQTGYSAKATVLTLQPAWPQITGTGTESLTALNTSNAILRDTVVYAQAEALPLAEEPLDAEVAGDTLSLDGVYDGLEPGRWVVISGNRTDVPNASGVKASELAMIAGVAQGSEAPLCVNFPSGFMPFTKIYYTTPANSMGDRLVVGAIEPQDLKYGVVPDFAKKLNALGSPTLYNQQFCGQIELAKGFFVNAYVPDDWAVTRGYFPDFTGLLVDPISGEPVEGGAIPNWGSFMKGGGYGPAPTYYAWRISTPKLHTILKFANSLAYVYDAASVSVLGNVVKATHGQSTGEILGDASAARAFQAFGLHQSPMTYLSAPTPDGAQSTLTVRVNEIAWHERGNLAFSGPRDRVFTTITDDDDKMTVVFGNGIHGARPPTGTANVKASYRYGIGAAGNVAAEKISQLATQPLGVQGVINPLAASGGADRDSCDEARQSAPIAVQALDRLVSVKDYADFARAYAGIGKSSATRLSDGRRQVVQVTVAGARDIPLDANSDLYRNLLGSLQAFGDPSLAVNLLRRKLKVLVMSAAIQLRPDYEWEAVEPSVRAALQNHYSFAARELGQSAFLSEAVRVAQGVEGVSYVDFSVFDSVSEDADAATLASLAGTLTLHTFVRADLARPNPDPGGADRFLAAELVAVTPAIPDTLILTNIGG